MGKTKKMDERLDSEKNSYSHILKYTGLFGGVQGLNMLVGVVRNKFTAMFLGPSGMGLLSLFNSTSNFLSSASNLGIPTSGVRVVSEADTGSGIDQAVAQVRSLSLLSAFLGALICALLGPLLNLFTFSWGNHTLHFILLAPTVFFISAFVFAVFCTHLWLLRRAGDSRRTFSVGIRSMVSCLLVFT